MRAGFQSAESVLVLVIPSVQAKNARTPHGLAQTPCRLCVILHGLARNMWGTVKTSMDDLHFLLPLLTMYDPTAHPLGVG